MLLEVCCRYNYRDDSELALDGSAAAATPASPDDEHRRLVIALADSEVAQRALKPSGASHGRRCNCTAAWPAHHLAGSVGACERQCCCEVLSRPIQGRLLRWAQSTHVSVTRPVMLPSEAASSKWCRGTSRCS